MYMGVSKNRGTPKWMVQIGKPYFLMDDLGGKPTIIGNIHMYIYTPSKASSQSFAPTDFHQLPQSSNPPVPLGSSMELANLRGIFWEKFDIPPQKKTKPWFFFGLWFFHVKICKKKNNIQVTTRKTGNSMNLSGFVVSFFWQDLVYFVIIVGAQKTCHVNIW